MMSDEWISVKDQLPEEGEKVLSFCPSDYEPIRIDYVMKIDGPFWACRHYNDYHNVTYWMPLPKSPEEL
jgi:hypothetical protein